MTDTHAHLVRVVDDADDMLRQFAALIEEGDRHPTLPRHGALEEWAQEIIAETGRPYTVALGPAGGPRIELVADGAWPARMVGHWGSATVERVGAHLDTVMDYFIDRDRD